MITVSIDRTKAIGTSSLLVGTTLVESTLEPSSDAEAVQRAKAHLTSATVHQNQHLMAWGAEDPWPNPSDPDPTNWKSLDRRIQLIIDTGGLPVITLCEAPWWMKGISQADEWATVSYERRVRDDYVMAWVRLCRRTAERYSVAPYYVRYFQVWNEMKGYWNPTTNTYNSGMRAVTRQDYSHGYTYMYNLVYDALKAVNPAIQVGGPYVVMDSWSDRATMSHPSQISGPYGTLDQRPLDVIADWLQKKRGAEFITVAGTTANEDDVRLVDAFTATQKFADIATWIAQRTDLPLWWAEWRATDVPTRDLRFSNALMAMSLLQMVLKNVTVALLWQPEADALGVSHPQGLWTDTRLSNGGQATPYHATQQLFKMYFGIGTTLYHVAVSSPQVRALASGIKTLLINTVNERLSVSVNNTVVTLEGYEVRLV